MKISFKIFVITYCLIMALTAVGGFVLINSLYRSELNQKVEETEKNLKMLIAYVAVLDELPNQDYASVSLSSLRKQMNTTGSSETMPFIGEYNDWLQNNKISEIKNLDDGQVVTGISVKSEGAFVQVSGRRDDTYITAYGSLDKVLANRDRNYSLYRRIIIISSIVVGIILLIFTSYITYPIKKITKAADLISAGDYSVRVNDSYRSMRSVEVQRMGETLNQLASSTEDYIEALQNEARKQEDFVGNFTHEIKTPLTSIIGYADLLRAGSISQEKQYEYSNFIYREGKRLEQMSFHLLDLIVMGKTDFEMSRISVGQLFKQLQSEAVFIEKKYNVEIILNHEKAYIIGEPTLLIAMLVNLIDNAAKASKAGDKIIVIGAKDSESYSFCVSDQGRGIPEDQIDKITEPFYMVDKSRARKQGGAGLGLALCNRIAEIHNSKLFITSMVGEGTDISFKVLCEKDAKEEEHEEAM